MANQISTTGNQPLTLTQQIIAVAEQLVPASENAIASRILQMERAGMKLPDNVENAGKAYAFALAGVPLQALKNVSIKLVQGKIPRRAPGFIPTPSELAALVRAEAAPLVEEIARLKETRETLEYKPPEPHTDDAKARVRALRQQVLDRAAEERLAAVGPARTTEDLNRMFRNKLPASPPPIRPRDGEYFKAIQQQEEMENGQASFSDQDQGNGVVSGGSEGREDDRGGGGES